MGVFSLEIVGLEQLKAGFEDYEKQAQKAIKKATDDTAKAVETDAKKRLKGLYGSVKHWITGRLAQSIYNRPSSDVSTKSYEKLVGTNVEYAPYIEFGTGDFVEVPDGAESIAAQYEGQGIRKVNIRGDSFLNWAAVNQASKYKERIITRLNKLKYKQMGLIK